MPHFSDMEQEDRVKMTALIPQARSNDAVAFSA